MHDMSKVIADILAAVDELKGSGFIEEIVREADRARQEALSGGLKQDSSDIARKKPGTHPKG